MSSKTRSKSTQTLETPATSQPPRAWMTRGVVLLVGIAVTILIAGICFGPFFPELFGGLLIDGAIATVWFGAAAIFGSVILRYAEGSRDASGAAMSRSFGVPQDDNGEAMSGALRLATSAGIGLGIVSLAMLGLGLIGALRTLVVWLIPIVELVIGLSDRPWRATSADRFREWFRSPAGFGSLWLIVAPFLAIALVGVSIMPGVLWKPYDPHPYDVMSYHLQIPREWFEAGRIVPLTHNVFSFFPFNIEMHYLAAMYLRGGPWAGMYLAQIMSLGFIVFTIIAVYGAVKSALRWTGDAEDARDANRAGTIAACVAATVPFVVMLACVCYIEGGMFFYATLSAAWLLRAILRSEHRVRDMAIAGAMAGFACGTKYTAMPMFLVAMPILAAVTMWWNARVAGASPRRVGPMIAGCLIFWLAGLLVFSPWLARNFVWTSGNPIFPLGMKALGRAHFTPDQVERFLRAHQPPAAKSSLPARLQTTWPEVLFAWQFGYLLVPMTLAAIAIGWRRIEVKFLALVLISIAGFWLLFTHQMSRFFLPAVPFAVMAIGFALRTPRASSVALVYIPLATLVGLFAQIDDAHPGLFHEFYRNVQLGQAFMFRVQDPRDLQLAEFKDIYDANGKVALIGDAQPFYCSLPMSHFKYRTVFDVVVPPGSNIVDAWVGEPVAKLRADGWWVVINRDAFAWMSGSFYGIDDLPKEYDGPRNEPVVLAPTSAPSSGAIAPAEK